jgi:hypothetical protein
MKTAALALLFLGVPIVASCGKSGASIGGSSCACPADTTVACTGALSPVKLPAASAVCGSKASSDDAPAKGYAIGATEVHYTSPGATACTTRVTVTDKAPPTLTCSGLPGVILQAPGDSVVAPLPSATDLCSEKVTVTASPPKLGVHGSVPVTYTATDASGNSATCKGSVTVENGFAATDLRLAHAEIVGSATSVIILWDTPADSDADHYRVERATSTTGPWTALATVPLATTMYTDASIGGPVAFYRVVTQVAGADGGASEPIRALAITASQYDLGVLPVPGLNMPANMSSGTVATMSTPIVGYVEYPTELSGGPYPLALLLHGNHGNCRPPDWDSTGTNPNLDDDCVITNDNTCPTGYTQTPNAQGLLGLGQTLASRGYVVASVDANAINCREDSTDGGYINARSELLIQHLREWRTWSTASAAPFAALFMGHVDMGHVVLFGHSRGAEAVAEVPQTFATSTDVAGIELAAIFSLAPTNFDDSQPGVLPFATLVPTCDGDVFTYTGVQLYDRRLRLGATKGSAVQFFMDHADHDHFNTEWVFDDNAIYLSSCTQGQVDIAAMQPRVLEVLVGTWVDEIVPSGATLEPFMHAVGDMPPSIAAYTAGMFPLDLRRSYSSPSLLEIDNFESGTLTTDLLGGTYTSTGGFTDGDPAVCTGVSATPCNVTYEAEEENFGWPHYNPANSPPERSAVALDWDLGTGVLVANLASGTGSFDASSYAALSLRVASRPAPTNTNAAGAPVDFEIAIVDASGHRASSLASQVTTIPNLYVSSYPRAVLQTVRLALPGLASSATPAVDLHHLQSIQLATSATGQASGSILVTDVEFAE